jgi:aspartate ammonia-lyase
MRSSFPPANRFSIMPGKVNPVMPEMLTMICFQVLGNDQSIAFCSQAGQLELNVMMPLIIFNILLSHRIFETGLRIFTKKCIKGITANEDRCNHFAERSAALVTALNPYIGYLKAAQVAKEVLSSHKSIREIVLEQKTNDRSGVEESPGSGRDDPRVKQPQLRGAHPCVI